MTYLPTQYINSNYTYSITNDYIIVRTNQNCYTNYSTTYCDCYNVFYKADYMIGNKYSCSTSSTTNSISYTNFTDKYWYRIDMPNILLMTFILLIICFLFPYKIISRIFGRWLKL